MSDSQTRSAYASGAQTYSDEWLAQPPPTDMYDLLEKYFKPGGSTVDIGCGNGRDAGWLAQHGFHVEGYDASVELIEIARREFPSVKFGVSQLPSLVEIQKQFDNVLCETVIMHLPVGQIPPALERLNSLLKPGGVLYLSWRVTEGVDQRHADGRLYSAFDPSLVTQHFDHILHFEDKTSLSSNRRVCRLIARR